MSEKTPRAPEPESERTIINGKTSEVIWNFVKTGAKSFAKRSIAPLALNIEIPTIIATKYGIIFTATFVSQGSEDAFSAGQR